MNPIYENSLIKQLLHEIIVKNRRSYPGYPDDPIKQAQWIASSIISDSLSDILEYMAYPGANPDAPMNIEVAVEICKNYVEKFDHLQQVLEGVTWPDMKRPIEAITMDSRKMMDGALHPGKFPKYTEVFGKLDESIRFFESTVYAAGLFDQIEESQNRQLSYMDQHISVMSLTTAGRVLITLRPGIASVSSEPIYLSVIGLEHEKKLNIQGVYGTIGQIDQLLGKVQAVWLLGDLKMVHDDKVTIG